MRLKIAYVGRRGRARRELSDLLERGGYVITPLVRTREHTVPGEFNVVVADDVSSADLARMFSQDDGSGKGRRLIFTAEPVSSRSVRSPRSRKGRIGRGTSIGLRALRNIVGKTQGEVARGTSMSQPQLSRVEARRDHLVSTLRVYVRALGGDIEVIAVVGGVRFRLRDV